MPAQMNFSCQRNANQIFDWAITDTNGNAVDLTGATFDLGVKYAPSDADNIAEGGVIVVGDAANGVIRIVFDGAYFAAVPGPDEIVRLVYDLIAHQDGLHICLARGQFLLLPGVS
jgi:hypothetical protein